MTVHAPYHFVPLSKWAYLPEWAHLVSHDVPFKDGLSGSIEYTLTNKTPMCVGNDQNKEVSPTVVEYAKDPHGKPIIPGTSLKGLVRSLLEVASFAKFNQIDEQHYSERDISSAESNYYKKVLNNDVVSAWIKYDTVSRQWVINRCNHTVVFHDEFNKQFGTKIQNIAFKQPAEKKFSQFPLSNKAVQFDIAERTIEGTKGKNVKVARAGNFGKGTLSGHPVFSGFRPGKKKYTENRLSFSYMFYGMQQTHQPFGQSSALVDKLFANHEPALVEYLKKNPHPEFGIPVFAVEKKDGSIFSLGFAKMPRVLYDLSVKDLVAQNQIAANSQLAFDFTELLFGSLRDKGLSLKSRVNFGDACVNGDFKSFLSKPLILGQPQASYLGAYLEQGKKDKNSEVRVGEAGSELAQYRRQDNVSGWKRYPVQSKFAERLPAELADKSKVQSKLKLINTGAQFKGRIQFHNLLPHELGGLLWALSMGDKSLSGRYCHTLGHGKPLGAGVSYFKSLNVNFAAFSQADLNEHQLIDLFISHMDEVYPFENTWLDSTQIKHLIGFSDQAANQDLQLDYMPLSSRDNSITTYASSMQGREKQVLPNWQAETGTLDRKEGQLNGYKLEEDLAKTYKSGRLAHLLESSDLPEADANIAEDMQEAIKDAKEAELISSLPEHVKRLRSLVTALEPHFGGTSPAAIDARRAKTSEVEALLNYFINEVDDSTAAIELLELAKDTSKCAYLDLAKNKKNKEKLKERKALLMSLADKFKVPY